MSDDVEKRTPFAHCVLCNGPIFMGEMAKYYGKNEFGVDEWIHYMKSWCQIHREVIAENDKKLCEDIGISLE